MTRADAARVLAVFQAAYQHVTVETLSADVWYGTALESCDAEFGRRVAGRIIAEDQWFPTPARFLEVKRAMAPREPAPAIESSSERRASPEFVKNIIAEMRETLKNAKGPLAKGLLRAPTHDHVLIREPVPPSESEEVV